MMSLFLRLAAAAVVLAFLADASATRAATRGVCLCRPHGTIAHARHGRARPRRSSIYVSVPSVPRYDPAEVEAEVHAIARYRTPYPYPALFGPF